MLRACGYFPELQANDKVCYVVSPVCSVLVTEVLSLMGVVGDRYLSVSRTYWLLSPSSSIPHPLGAPVVPPLLNWTCSGLTLTVILTLSSQPIWPTV